MKSKLVRDHCPAVIEGECVLASTEAEYQMALLLKAHEEIQEIADCPEDPEEYADLLEVMLALAEHNGVDGDDILDALVMKREHKGGFEDGQIWETASGDIRFKEQDPLIEVWVSPLHKWITLAMRRLN